MADYRKLVEEKRMTMLNALIESMEKNPERWVKGWYSTNVPFNGATLKNYNGLNSIFLAVAAERQGFTDPRWVTFNQAKDLGASIKAGSKSSDVFFWSQYDKKTKKPFDERVLDGMSDEERNEYLAEHVSRVLKYYNVFNAEQCDNFPENTREKEMTAEERQAQNERIETIIANSAAPVHYDGGNNAYYSLRTDDIHLPEVDKFKTMNDYYATALHEIGHSTGHSSRLNRDMSGGFGSANYVVEELRAELTSAFMQSDMGIDLSGAEIANHAAYLKSWLSVVKKDPNVFYRAAADAGKITSYIKENYLEKAKTVENTKEKQNVAQEEALRQEIETLVNKEGKPYVLYGQSEIGFVKENTSMPLEQAEQLLGEMNEAFKGKNTYKTILNVCYSQADGCKWANDIQYDVGSENGIEKIKIFGAQPYYRDYALVQNENQNAVVAQRIGDFYEVMGDKAQDVAKELNLTLTGRDVGLRERVPMVGFPYHVADNYIQQLSEAHDVVVIEKDKTQKKISVKSKAREEHKKEPQQQVQQAEQAQQVGQVELVFPLENKLKEYGKSTMLRMPKGVEFSSFVFLAPTSKLHVEENAVRLVTAPNFEFTLKDDGREVKLTSEELRAVLDGKESGKSAQRVSASKRNVARLEELKNNVPAEMKGMPNWCVYRTKWNEEKGKKDKFVLSAHTGKWAKIDDSSTWADFDTAYNYAVENNCEGLSFALDGSGISCIDLDKCIVKDGKLNGVATTKAEGEMNDIANKLVPELANVYCEKSTSGNGLHFFLKDDILSNGKYCNRTELNGEELEVYDNSRFMSMTGNMFGKSKELTQCPSATMTWLRKQLGERAKEEPAPRAYTPRTTDLRYQSDAELIERIRNSKRGEMFDTLYNGGDVTGDKHRDDLALLNMLAFFSDCNEEQMRSVFESSGRYRPQTKNAAYVTRSIQKACSSLKVRYSGGQKNGSKKIK